MRPPIQAGRHILRPSRLPYHFSANLSSPRLAIVHHQHELRLRNLSLVGSSPGGRRCFSFGTAVNTAVDSAESLFMGLHTLSHTPWFITIPLAAIGVNLVLRLPVAIYTRRIVQTRAKLQPLYMAWAFKNVNIIGHLHGLSPKEKSASAKKVTKGNVKAMDAKFGVQTWKVWARPLVMLPFWITILEALRRMCGGPRGLIGTIMLGPAKPVDPVELVNAQAASQTLDPMTSPTGVIEIEPAAQVSDSLLEGTVEAARTSVANSSDHLYQVADPSLATEGCLWFTDLTQADPYYILPTGLAVVLFINVLPSSTAEIRELFLGSTAPSSGPTEGISIKSSPLSRGIHRSLLVVCPLIPLLLADLPAALTLYWLASASCGLVLNKVIDHYMPIKAKKTKDMRPRLLGRPVIRPPPPTPPQS